MPTMPGDVGETPVNVVVQESLTVGDTYSIQCTSLQSDLLIYEAAAVPADTVPLYHWNRLRAAPEFVAGRFVVVAGMGIWVRAVAGTSTYIVNEEA